MKDDYEALKLGNQLCFPLYVCSKEFVKRYKPYLEDINLTYTQYITMLVMWEKEQINVKELGEKLYLDSGTLTPVLKKLEQKNFVKRTRDKEDERVLNVTLTDSGRSLREKAAKIPKEMSSCIRLSENEVNLLLETLDKILREVTPNNE